MLTHNFIISNWEQDWDKTYFTFTDDGESIVYNSQTGKFYYQDYKYQISSIEVCELLNY